MGLIYDTIKKMSKEDIDKLGRGSSLSTEEIQSYLNEFSNIDKIPEWKFFNIIDKYYKDDVHYRKQDTSYKRTTSLEAALRFCKSDKVESLIKDIRAALRAV